MAGKSGVMEPSVRQGQSEYGNSIIPVTKSPVGRDVDIFNGNASPERATRGMFAQSAYGDRRVHILDRHIARNRHD